MVSDSGLGGTWSDRNLQPLKIAVEGDLLPLPEVDGTPPTLTTAFAFSVNSATGIALEYNETLDANSIPDPSAFEVKVQNNSVAVSSVTRHTTDTTLALLLSENPRPGDTITISYTVPRTNPIQDEAGNDAAAFSEQAVTNNLAATAPDAPGNLAASPGTVADTMVLTWDTPWANGRHITKFQVRYVQGTTAGGTWADILNSDADTTTHTVTGLTAGTQYTFEVRAVNGIGQRRARDRDADDGDADVGADAHRQRERRDGARRGRRVRPRPRCGSPTA